MLLTAPGSIKYHRCYISSASRNTALESRRRRFRNSIDLQALLETY